MTRVNFTPHHKMMTSGGQYEYFESPTFRPLRARVSVALCAAHITAAFAIAELVDNSLTATQHQSAERNISVRWV